MMILLVRHGQREPRIRRGFSLMTTQKHWRERSPQRRGDDQLSVRGSHQVEALARALRLRGVSPTSIVTSRSTDAQESADRLAELLDAGQNPIPLDALTPFCGPGRIEDLVEQATGPSLGWDAKSFDSRLCLVVVGHEGRLSDLRTEMTGIRSGPIPHGGAVAIEGDTINDFLAGTAREVFRYPTADFQEDAIRAKVSSKMTVSTLLAGFVFSALAAVLLLDHERGWPWHRIWAVATLTASFALLVTAVYFYDQLGTPSGFWTDADKPRGFWDWLKDLREYQLDQRWKRAYERARAADVQGGAGLVPNERDPGYFADEDTWIHRDRAEGPVYWLMLRVSRYLFTPAMLLAGLGFVFLLAGTDDARILVLGLASLAFAGAFAAFHRPTLGAD